MRVARFGEDRLGLLENEAMRDVTDWAFAHCPRRVADPLIAFIRALERGKTTVLEMMVTRELGDPFRRDALALPVRHLAKYKATAAK